MNYRRNEFKWAEMTKLVLGKWLQTAAAAKPEDDRRKGSNKVKPEEEKKFKKIGN